jgi:hypothetical protein
LWTGGWEVVTAMLLFIHVLNEADMTLFQSDPTYRSHGSAKH